MSAITITRAASHQPVTVGGRKDHLMATSGARIRKILSGPDRSDMTEQATSGLEAITGAVKRAGEKGPPPVHLWNPPFCGDLDMRIASDGTWFYMKTPIGRPALVKLFSSVLKREGEKYFLVTPVEKIGITVDDAPFTAVEMKRGSEGAARTLSFRTNVDEWVACG